MTQSTEHRHSPGPNWCNFKLLRNVNFCPRRTIEKLRNFYGWRWKIILAFLLCSHCGWCWISMLEYEAYLERERLNEVNQICAFHSIDISLWGRQKFFSFRLQTIRIRLKSIHYFALWTLCNLLASKWIRFDLHSVELVWLNGEEFMKSKISNRKFLTKVSFHNQLW